MNCSDALKKHMKVLAEDHVLERVEVQLLWKEPGLCGTVLTSRRSVLYLPGLGWTMKNDDKGETWADAEIVGTV